MADLQMYKSVLADNDRLRARLAETSLSATEAQAAREDAEKLAERLQARLDGAERIVNAVALVHKEANLNGGMIVLSEGCALFLGAWQYRNRHQATPDSASAVQPERCCLDYPRCDCNSPPEPDDDWLCFQRPAQPKVTP